jgi:hypothetical protein
MKYERRPKNFEDGRRPQLKKMEDDLNFVFKWKKTSIFWKMEDALSFFTMEDDLKYLKIEDNLNF